MGVKLAVFLALISALAATNVQAQHTPFLKGVGLQFEDVIIGKQVCAFYYHPVKEKVLLHAAVSYFVNEDPNKKNPEQDGGYEAYYPENRLQRFGIRAGLERPIAIRNTPAFFSPFITFHASRMLFHHSDFYDTGRDTFLPAPGLQEDMYYPYHYAHGPHTIGTAHAGVNFLMMLTPKLCVRIQAGLGLRKAWYKDYDAKRDTRIMGEYDKVAHDRIFGAGVEYKIGRLRTVRRRQQ